MHYFSNQMCCFIVHMHYLNAHMHYFNFHMHCFLNQMHCFNSQMCCSIGVCSIIEIRSVTRMFKCIFLCNIWATSRIVQQCLHLRLGFSIPVWGLSFWKVCDLHWFSLLSFKALPSTIVVRSKQNEKKRLPIKLI